MATYYVVTHTDPGTGGAKPYNAKLGPYKTKADAERAARWQRADKRTTARVVKAGS